MLQDLQMPGHGPSATGPGRMAAEATVCMSLIIVAVQHSVLCVCLWPRSATAAASQCLAGERSALLTMIADVSRICYSSCVGCVVYAAAPSCLSFRLCGVEPVGMVVPRSCTNIENNHKYVYIAKRTISQIQKAIATTSFDVW